MRINGTEFDFWKWFSGFALAVAVIISLKGEMVDLITTKTPYSKEQSLILYRIEENKKSIDKLSDKIEKLQELVKNYGTK